MSRNEQTDVHKTVSLVQNGGKSVQFQQPKMINNEHDDDQILSTKATTDGGSSSAVAVLVPMTTRTTRSTATTTTSGGAAVNVTKTLSTLLKIPSNRSCADCRSALVDPSQIHASVCPSRPHPQDLTSFRQPAAATISLTDFSLTHQAFAPPQLQHEVRSVHRTDPALWINQRFGGHGVFVCASCAKAHALLPSNVTVVHPVQPPQVPSPPRKKQQPLPNHEDGGAGSTNPCDNSNDRTSTNNTTALTQPNQEQLGTTWTEAQLQSMVDCGSNARSWQVYEQYLPDAWKNRRPSPVSSLADRLVFVRAKYEALAFCMPPPGPLSHVAWCHILERHAALHHYSVTSELKNYRHLTPNSSTTKIIGVDGVGDENYAGTGTYSTSTNTSPTSKKARLQQAALAAKDAASAAAQGARRGNTGEELPNRLVDFFCVVSSSMQLVPVPTFQKEQQQATTRLEDLNFVPYVSDCYPKSTSYKDTEFPVHLGTFVLPEGCHARSQPLAPSFYAVVLTTADGSRLYGAVLQIWEDAHELDSIRTSILENPEYSEDNLPRCLSSSTPKSGANKYDPNAVVFFPKCLVILSHHAMFDTFREILLQLYRITLVEAPLPIERYIANFVSEVPLPPAGCIKVEFGFTNRKVVTIERPALNQLPLANFSFRPLFATLSVGNIITVIGCLLQECRIVVLSKHYSLLCPVTEALLSFLFPFTWQGLYIVRV
jgi:DENN (AEX-3) domain/uDENN domain